MRPRIYRTGDLYLENDWSLYSILEHIRDPLARWSNVGIFLLDPDKDPASETGVDVCLLTDGKLRLVPLDTLLRRPQLQAAAYRSLSSSYRGQTTFEIENYLRGLLNEGEIKQLPGAFREFLDRESPNPISQAQKDKKYTNLGTPVDAKGRDLKPPGFSKGNPNNTRRYAFSTTDFVMATLASSNIINYDPEVPLSIFQEGGTLDTIYGSETPLFPRQVDEDEKSAHEQIIISSQQEALVMIQAYLRVKSKMNIGQYSSYPPVRVNASREAFLDGNGGEGDDREEIGNGGGIPTSEAAYVEQMSNYDRAQRKNLTVQIAEEQGSETMDRKLRQRKGLAAAYTRPSPKFK